MVEVKQPQAVCEECGRTRNDVRSVKSHHWLGWARLCRPCEEKVKKFWERRRADYTGFRC